MGDGGVDKVVDGGVGIVDIVLRGNLVDDVDGNENGSLSQKARRGVRLEQRHRVAWSRRCGGKCQCLKIKCRGFVHRLCLLKDVSLPEEDASFQLPPSI